MTRSRKMRIAHVTATFPPYYAGTGNICFYNALELARRGHQVTVFTAAYPPGDFDYPPEITVKRLPPLFRFGNAPFLPGLLKIKDFDIIHLHHPFIFGSEMIWLVSKIRHIPYVFTHHSDLIGSGFRTQLFSIYDFFSAPLVFFGAAKLIVVTKDHAETCIHRKLFCKRAADVSEVPNGIDINVFSSEKTGMDIRQKYHLPSDATLLLFVGALDRAHHYKGADQLLKAFAMLDHRAGAYLLIVGDGDIKSDLISLAKDLKIEDDVIFVGALPNASLPVYYSAADALVLPSSTESFGLVLIEAMACSRPVVAYRISGVRSIVTDGIDGFLANPNDLQDLCTKMQMMLDLPAAQRKAMGEAGRKKVEAIYNWRPVIDKLESVYNNALGLA